MSLPRLRNGWGLQSDLTKRDSARKVTLEGTGKPMQQWKSRLMALMLLGAVVGCNGQVGDPNQPGPGNTNQPNVPLPGPGNCDPGYERVDGECRDIDECLTATCDANASCQNQPGTFACVCNVGFDGDGTTCTAQANRCDDFAAILSAPANRCVTCHDTSPGVEGGNLDLLSDGSAARLLNARSGNTSCRDELLIDVDNWQNSMILKVVDPARYAAWGDDPCIRMMPFGGNGVSEADVTCFEEWVQKTIEENDAPPPPPVIPFEVMPAESALAKAKFILHGGPVTDAELAAVKATDGTLNPAALQQVIRDWMGTPESTAKVRSFLQLSLQQYEINPRNQAYRDQFDQISGNDVAIDRNAFFANLEDSFVNTAWNIVSSGGDFRQVVTTRTWQVTTAIMAGLVYADRQRNPGDRFELLAHLQPSDYTDWRDVTFTQAANANEVPQFQNTAAFARSLRNIGDGGSLALRAPRVGFFNTPTFFESWETNEDNQFRVATNQAILAALDILFEAGDTTEQTNLNGLATEHSEPDTACYQCHRLLDPMRLQYQNVYNYRYRVRDNIVTNLAPGFAFQGYTATPATMDDFGQALVSHPRFPVAWVQKVCMWANSQRCLEDDPEFMRIVNKFTTDYDLMDMIVEVFTSPLVTGAAITETHDTTEFFVSISRSNHLCSAMQTRIRGARAERCAAERAADPDANPQVCQTRNNIGCNASGTIRSMAELISSDAYGRGANDFIQESVSGPFNARALTEICTQLATREVGGGNQTFTPGDIPGSLDRMVRYVMGLPASHPRYQAARDALQRAYDIGRASPVCGQGQDVVDANRNDIVCGFNLDTTRALYISWITACSSSELAGLGM